MNERDSINSDTVSISIPKHLENAVKQFIHNMTISEAGAEVVPAPRIEPWFDEHTTMPEIKVGKPPFNTPWWIDGPVK
jgi:hypothetical protein